KKSLESRLANLPESLKEKVKIARRGVVALNPSELAALPIDLRMTFSTTAWQTFIANGYADKLEKLESETYKTLRKAYTTLEGMNFIAGLATFRLLGSSKSSLFEKPTKMFFYQTLFRQPLLTIFQEFYEVNPALKKLAEPRTKVSSLRSFTRFFFTM